MATTILGLVVANTLEKPIDIMETSADDTTGLAKPKKKEKRQITRNRISYSCQTCRRRKVKCDKVHPVCGGCIKANETCIYGSAEKDDFNKDDNHSSIDGRHGAKRKPSFGSPAREASPPLDPLVDASQRPANLVAVEAQLARLASLIEDLRSTSTRNTHPNGPLTPMSSQSKDQDSDQASHEGQSMSPLYEADRSRRESTTSIHQPLKFDVERAQTVRQKHMSEAMWSSLTEEIEQLNSLVRGFPTFPAGPGLKDLPACGERKFHVSSKPFSADALDVPLSFHRSLHSQEHETAEGICRLCHQRASDKSALLLGTNALDPPVPAKIEIYTGFPTEKQSNVLFRSWLTGVSTVLPFVPIRQAFRKYAQFWEWQKLQQNQLGSTTETADMYFRTVLSAIWYAGSVSISLKGLRHWFPGISRAQLCMQFHDQIVQFLTFVSFPTNYNMPLLGVLAILQSIPCGEEEPLQTSSYINLLSRLTQGLGLHREVGLFKGASWEAEMRRRMWWQVIRLDTALAVSGGYSTYISESLYDTRMLSELKDAMLGTSEGIKYQNDVSARLRKVDMLDEPLNGQNTSKASVTALTAKGVAIVDVALRNVFRLHHATRLMTRDDMQKMNKLVADAEKEVKAMINCIPAKGSIPEFGFLPDTARISVSSQLDCDPALGEAPSYAEFAYYSGMSNDGMTSTLTSYHRKRINAFHKWARITLSLLSDKLHCVAYAPLLKNAKSKLWSAARQCALHHSHAYMRKFLSLATDPELEAFRWTWPGMHQPMHAAMIILIDLYERPDSVEAPRSREFIDEMFALSDPSFGIVGGENGVSSQRPLREGGADAFDMLRDLRNTAWIKAKLDPKVLWTVDEQIQVGVARALTDEERVSQNIREDSLIEDPKLESNPSVSPNSSSHSTANLVLNLARKEFGKQLVSDVPEKSVLETRDQTLAQEQQPSTEKLAILEGQRLMPYPLDDTTRRNPVAEYSNNQNDTGCKDENKSTTTAGATSEPSRSRTGAPPTHFKTHMDRAMDLAYRQGWEPEQPQKIIDPKPPPRCSKTIDGLFSMTQPQSLDVTNTSTTATHKEQIQQPLSAARTPASFSVETPQDFLPAQMPAFDDPTFSMAGNSFVLSDLNNNQTDASLYAVNGGETDLGFDWDRWDSVFGGQYGGFTDLMEDIVWDDPKP